MVSDQDGNELVNPRISCGGERRVEFDDFTDWASFDGTVLRVDGIDYVCVLASDLVHRYFVVEAPEGALTEVGHWWTTPPPPLQLWQPEVTVEQLDDQVVVSWDRAAPGPPAGLDARSSLRVWGLGGIAIALELTATEVTIPVTAFGEQTSRELHLAVVHENGLTYVSYDTSPIPVVLAPP